MVGPYASHPEDDRVPPAPLRLLVLDGRSPDGRSGRAVADWFVDRARRRAALRTDHVVLHLLGLPLFLTDSGDPVVARWRARVGAADVVAVVTPEYNQSFPAGVKQAIDVVRDEWADKPVGLVTYGGISGGLRAADQLRPVFAELRGVAVRDTVSFVRPWDRLDDRGRLTADAAAEAAADVLLAELERWGGLLREVRADREAAA